MKGWLKIFLAVLPAVVLLGLLILFLRRCCCSKRSRSRDFPDTINRMESMQSGITKLHLAYNSSSSKSGQGFQNHRHDGPHLHDIGDKRRPNYYVIRRGVLAKPLFSWSDHPWLVSEAVEHGWSRFAFAVYSSGSLSRSPTTTLWDFCTVCDFGRDGEAEISWEVGPESADSMQKIRLNPGLKKIHSNNPLYFSYVRTILPLPGPSLGNSFPQVAYFEITILSGEEDVELVGTKGSIPHEGERTKLIQETAMKLQSDALIHVTSRNASPIQTEERKDETGLITLGLICGGPSPFSPPGSYPGSIGFNSNGSVYLDGINLVFEAKKGDWRQGNKVIGCGFDPGRKKVFFTVDSELVHVINCKSEEFSSPLYPTIAANIDVTMLVNLGQSPFQYRPANSQRTANPCFLRPSPDTAAARAIGYEEDSQELFSMGRIDSQWSATKKNSTNDNGEGTPIDFTDLESEADLFEIVLDDSGKSR
ncbi:uncharacterized protein LOC131219174 [Magnolia sinica]|uniref:uncharacterized protein LOC131219174 n=1 Tax=Magnolia sinica TaxID=86752 RepID=UPI002657C07D|nr:uncharacterized protein LOC131219174 [Magnolia sinica]